MPLPPLPAKPPKRVSKSYRLPQHLLDAVARVQTHYKETGEPASETEVVELALAIGLEQILGEPVKPA